MAILDSDTLYVANVGDSRAVMCDSHLEAVPLSYDHKPDQVSSIPLLISCYLWLILWYVSQLPGLLLQKTAHSTTWCYYIEWLRLFDVIQPFFLIIFSLIC